MEAETLIGNHHSDPGKMVALSRASELSRDIGLSTQTPTISVLGPVLRSWHEHTVRTL